MFQREQSKEHRWIYFYNSQNMNTMAYAKLRSVHILNNLIEVKVCMAGPVVRLTC